MKAIVSPYFQEPGSLQMLYRGNFVKHYDVEQRGQQIHLGLMAADCSIAVAAMPEMGTSALRDSILSVHDAKYLDYLQTAWETWSQMPGASAEILPNISPNRHSLQFSDE